MTPFSLIGLYRNFGRNYCFSLHTCTHLPDYMLLHSKSLRSLNFSHLLIISFSYVVYKVSYISNVFIFLVP